MIDGRGRARITDFGLAVAADEASDANRAGRRRTWRRSSSPAQAATVRSDIYALGLVLYELFTGKRPFDAATLAGLWQNARTRQPPSPLRSWSRRHRSRGRARHPAMPREGARRRGRRRRSQVAPALPGGDPLAAAIAAGETPSPEMVAAAGGEGALTPGRAWLWLAITCLTVAGIWFISPSSTDFGLAPMENSPEVLRDRTRSMLERLGYPIRVADDATWLWRKL